MQQLTSANRMSAAVALLLAGYDLSVVTKRTKCSPTELEILQELLDARLILPQPTTQYTEAGHVDIIKEYEELIPVFKGQVHVALLAATVGAGASPIASGKGATGPELLKDYSVLLLNLSKLYQAYGISPTPITAHADEPTLKELLAPVPAGPASLDAEAFVGPKKAQVDAL